MTEQTGSKKTKKEKAPTAAEIQADLEARRAALADTVDSLTASLDPRANIAELKTQLSTTAANASDEAQAFVDRLRSGDERATQAIGITATAVTALLGIALIRRGR